MTDKEQVIIDGVDVSECEFYQIKANELYPKAHYCGSMKNTFCENNPNCYFKQLVRKTQECEGLKEYLQANQPTGICETCTAKVLLQNDKYRKALEEIENFINYEFSGQNEWVKTSILGIINKAKE